MALESKTTYHARAECERCGYAQNAVPNTSKAHAEAEAKEGFHSIFIRNTNHRGSYDYDAMICDTCYQQFVGWWEGFSA